MSICSERSFKLGKLCLSNDDYYIIILNVLTSILLVAIFYVKKVSENSQNLSVLIKNNFTLLGEGLLNNFYSPMASLQKNPNTKKKVTSKGAQQQAAIVEKAPNNNELKCNSCGRSVEVNYQYTIPKLNKAD
jgi:hypothetical protein